MQQVDGRSDNERRPARLSNREHGRESLAGPRRQDDQSATTRLPPRGHGFGLVWERHAIRRDSPLDGFVVARRVLVRDLTSDEVLDNRAVVSPFGPLGARPRIECDSRQIGPILVPTAGHHDRAAIRPESEGIAHFPPTSAQTPAPAPPSSAALLWRSSRRRTTNARSVPSVRTPCSESWTGPG